MNMIKCSLISAAANALGQPPKEYLNEMEYIKVGEQYILVQKKNPAYDEYEHRRKNMSYGISTTLQDIKKN